MQILVLLAIGLLLYIIIDRLWQQAKNAPPPPKKMEKMVRCEHCGLHVPEQEAIQYHQQYFCSVEHLEERQKR